MYWETLQVDKGTLKTVTGETDLWNMWTLKHLLGTKGLGNILGNIETGIKL